MKLAINKRSKARKFELLLNAVLVIFAVLFFGMLWKRFQPQAQEARRIEAGQKFDLAEIDWTKSERTLVLALSTSCHVCTESAPFYRRLSAETGKNGTRVIALFVQPVAEAERYLKQLGVSFPEVRQVDLVKLGVLSTPALVLVNNQGIVKNVWLGKLGSDTEATVLERVTSFGEGRGGRAKLISARELAAAIASDPKLVIVDVDSRDLYAQGHIPGAKNIPFDELETRLANELSRDARIVIYDHRGTLTQGALEVLLENGLTRVAILGGGYNEWQQAQAK